MAGLLALGMGEGVERGVLQADLTSTRAAWWRHIGTPRRQRSCGETGGYSKRCRSTWRRRIASWRRRSGCTMRMAWYVPIMIREGGRVFVCVNLAMLVEGLEVVLPLL